MIFASLITFLTSDTQIGVKPDTAEYRIDGQGIYGTSVNAGAFYALHALMYLDNRMFFVMMNTNSALLRIEIPKMSHRTR